LNLIISVVLLSLRILFITNIILININKLALYNFIDLFILNNFKDNITFNSDSIRTIFISIVLTIRSFAFIYTNWYVGNQKRFSILVLLFVSRMIILILFTNIWIFIWGWDFLGVVSYLLVINYLNQASSNAGMITILSNRVGDRFMLIRLSLIRLNGNWNSLVINKNLYYILIILIILTSVTKRAQLPFCAWLPAAMAAPTPISALVHSSTLVTAGIYLIIRFNQNNPSIIILIIGIFTASIAGINACNGYDFKKLIALSTLSQLGFMFISLGIGAYKLSLFHLVSHGLVKALLFLSAGIIIHQVQRTQDLRQINGLITKLPIVSICILLTRFTLSGLPFLACYFSKETVIMNNFLNSVWIIIYIYFIALLTINYRIRLILALFHKPSYWIYNNRNEQDNNGILPLIGLLPFTVFWGTYNNWFFLPYINKLNRFFFIFNIILWIFIIIAYWKGNKIYNNKLWGNNILNKLITNLLFLPLIRRNILNKLLIIGFKTIKLLESSWSENLGGQGFNNLFNIFLINIRILFISMFFIINIAILFNICLYSLY